MQALVTENLTKIFGGLAAVSDISLEIIQGELVGLIGPNGAGKTTLFNLLTGEYEPSAGNIYLNVNGELKKTNGLKPYQVTKLGIARTFQNIRLFKDLTVADNVKIGMNKNIQYNSFQAIFRTRKYYDEEERVRKKTEDLLEIVGLKKEIDLVAKNLPYGQQRRLEIARALATQPKILFLDEPAAGMNPQETKDLTVLIHELRDKYKLTIILIEHDMSLVMTVCQRIYVLDYGRLIAQGTPKQIRHNPKVITAYLGEEE